MVCQGCCGSVYDLGSEADQSTMELVRYHTSQRKMRDIYQSVYLLQRVPSLLLFGAQPRRKAIQDILSSLKSRLHRCGCSATIRNLESHEEQVRLNRCNSYEEDLGAAHQRALDTAKVLASDIKRLSQQGRGRSWSHSRNCSQSRSCSRTRSQSRSHSRANTIHNATCKMYVLCPLMDP